MVQSLNKRWNNPLDINCRVKPVLCGGGLFYKRLGNSDGDKENHSAEPVTHPATDEPVNNYFVINKIIHT
jgi:hypothetical protein